jgi:hypothetical protein
MPQINILNILQGDNQSIIVDKLNYNFDQILSAGGGPQGAQGLIGPTGPIGPQGPQGVQGAQGPSGTKWFVQDAQPASGGITGSNPWTYPTLGDYWLDPDSANQDIYVFSTTGWINTGYGLNAGDLFQKVTPIDINGGATAQAILLAGATSGDKSFVLSDSSIGDYTPGGTAIVNLNYENSKLKVATKDDRTKLISFGRSTYDVTPGGSGFASSSYNPYIAWDLSFNTSGASGAGPGFYGINFTNPKGSIGIVSNGATAESGINILSSSEITAQSNSDNIVLKTSSINKGTFIDGSTNGGFFEFSNNSSTPVNQSLAPLFANSTGLGIGLGTGQFKQTGNDSRRLAVNGNSSISKTPSYHTSNLFTGQSGTPNDDKGVLFVEGHSMFGYTNPTGDNSGGIQTTGPSERAGRYPQLFVTSPSYGPGIQVKTKGVNYSPRTIIGDGTFDSNEGITTAGTGPDITQEFFTGTGYNFSTNKALISYQHKITNASNTGVTGPVFSISTFTNSGVYNPTTTARRTLIQTTNSNKLLEMMANGTGGANGINIGFSNQALLSIYGPSGSATGGVTIGASASSFPPYSGGSLTPLATFLSARANHSLVVTGTQTIGTISPISLFNPTGTNQGALLGGASHLKIYRQLYTTTSTKGSIVSGGGPSVNNYPNGLEITSHIPFAAGTAAGSPNQSVAIAVGGSSQIYNTISGDDIPLPATGFFVSNTGQNIAVGQYIDYSAAIGVSGAGSDAAISAKGDINGIGNLSISASGTFGGNVNASGGNITNSLNVGDSLFNSGVLTINGTSSKIKEYHGSFGFSYNTGVANPTGKGAAFTSVNDYSGLPAGFTWNNTSSFNGGGNTGFVKLDFPGVSIEDNTCLHATPRYSLDGSSYGTSGNFTISVQINGTNQLIFYFRNIGASISVGSISISFSVIERL